MIRIKLVSSFAMIRLAILLFVTTNVLSAVIYIDRFTVDSNRKVCNWSTSYTYDEKRNSIVNLSVQISKPLARVLIYARVNLAENEHDREYRREFIRTVVDAEKAYKGAQQNFLVSSYMKNMKRYMDFEVEFPLQPVSVFNSIFQSLVKSNTVSIFKKTYRFINSMVDAHYLPALLNVKGFMEFRVLGKFEGIKSMTYMGLIKY